MSADESLRAELEGWNAGVKEARASYERSPVSTTVRAAEPAPAQSVSRERYMEMVKANARLAKELRQTRAALEEARRTIAVAKMRGKPPR